MAIQFKNTYFLDNKDIGDFQSIVHKERKERESLLEIPHRLDCKDSRIKVLTTKKMGIKGAYYTFSDRFTSEYLAAVFSSNFGMRYLKDFSNRNTDEILINISKLTRVPVFGALFEYQKELGSLQMLIQNLYEGEMESSNKCRLILNLLEDVRDGMILELYFSEDFKSRNIRLWRAWSDVISKHAIHIDMNNVSLIYSEIKGLTSPVRRALKSIQVLRNSPNFEF